MESVRSFFKINRRMNIHARFALKRQAQDMFENKTRKGALCNLPSHRMKRFFSHGTKGAEEINQMGLFWSVPAFPWPLESTAPGPLASSNRQ